MFSNCKFSIVQQASGRNRILIFFLFFSTELNQRKESSRERIVSPCRGKPKLTSSILEFTWFKILSDDNWQFCCDEYYQEFWVLRLRDEISNDKPIDFLFHRAQRDFVTLSQLRCLGESRMTKLCAGYVPLCRCSSALTMTSDDSCKFFSLRKRDVKDEI